ncbi:hypothetical protein quinque_004846 [Culex quinquefasciatus]
MHSRRGDAACFDVDGSALSRESESICERRMLDAGKGLAVIRESVPLPSDAAFLVLDQTSSVTGVNRRERLDFWLTERRARNFFSGIPGTTGGRIIRITVPEAGTGTLGAVTVRE